MQAGRTQMQTVQVKGNLSNPKGKKAPVTQLTTNHNDSTRNKGKTRASIQNTGQATRNS